MWRDNRIAKIGSSAFESPPFKKFLSFINSSTSLTFLLLFLLSSFCPEKSYVAMPGVQHLIDFVLNEVALRGNQGVYSLFTKTHFFLTPATHVISHVDFKYPRNYVESPPQSEEYVEFLLYYPSQNFLITDLSLRSCGVDPMSIYILYLKPWLGALIHTHISLNRMLTDTKAQRYPIYCKLLMISMRKLPKSTKILTIVSNPKSGPGSRLTQRCLLASTINGTISPWVKPSSLTHERRSAMIPRSTKPRMKPLIHRRFESLSQKREPGLPSLATHQMSPRYYLLNSSYCRWLLHAGQRVLCSRSWWSSVARTNGLFRSVPMLCRERATLTSDPSKQKRPEPASARCSDFTATPPVFKQRKNLNRRTWLISTASTAVYSTFSESTNWLLGMIWNNSWALMTIGVGKSCPVPSASGSA